ncbi:MAG: SH3 domain-containing protein [Chloroflexi bacterium]|nr:SH3 domain-containing protein [Chloroflexota bacterium]
MLTKFRVLALFGLLFTIVSLGCGIAARSVETPSPTPRPTLHPTFTPTPVQPTPPPPPPTPTTPPATAPTNTPIVVEPTTPPEQASPTPEQPTPEPPTPTPEPAQVEVTAQTVNLRAGPSTRHPRVGRVARGQRLPILAKTPKEDWFQVGAGDGKVAWIINNARWTKPIGDIGTVPVAENIPTPPPPPKPKPTKPPAPTPTPAPSYLFTRLSNEARPNSNPIVSFFGGLYNQNLDLDAPISGYKMVAIAPNGERKETNFLDVFLRGDPGLDSEFVYNAKIEFPLMGGVFKVFVADGGGKQVSEVWEANVQGETRTFLPRWRQK